MMRVLKKYAMRRWNNNWDHKHFEGDENSPHLFSSDRK